MSDLTRLGVADLLGVLGRGEASAVEVAEAHIAAMAAARQLNIYITETADRALAMARASDERRARGEARPLDGIPVAVKDLFCTEGTLTTAGSHILDGFVPTYESTVTAKLWADGAVMVGKANQDEFAMGSSTTTSHYGPTANPWTRRDDPATRMVPGGSSGGSAAAVAAFTAPAALGTDTGGSIRQPASYCGVVGVRPTYGRCSRWGVIAYASSLDQAGTFGRSVGDAALVLRAIAGFDPKDSTSADLPVPDFATALSGDGRGLRVGIPEEYRVPGLSDAIAAVWDRSADWLRDAGAEPVPISLPHTRYALPAYYIIACAEASSNLARYDGVRYGLRQPADGIVEMYERTRAAGFGAEVTRRIMIGTYVLSAGYYDAYYRKAQQVRTLIRRDFETAFEACDVILVPTAPSAAFPIGERQDDPVTMFLNDVFTITVNMAGLPGVSVPVGLDEAGLPLGVQVIGRPFDEETMLRAADILERAAEFRLEPPRD